MASNPAPRTAASAESRGVQPEPCEAEARQPLPLHRALNPRELRYLRDYVEKKPLPDWRDDYRRQLERDLAEQDATDVALIVAMIGAGVMLVGLASVLLP